MRDIPKLVKHCTRILERFFKRHPVEEGFPIQLERKMVILVTTLIAFEMSILLDPFSIKINLFNLLQSGAALNSFHCQCGATF